jgi:hypothetical protein
MMCCCPSCQIATFEPEPYVLVLSNKQFYVLDVVDKASNRALTVKELQTQVERILQASQESNDGMTPLDNLLPRTQANRVLIRVPVGSRRQRSRRGHPDG